MKGCISIRMMWDMKKNDQNLRRYVKEFSKQILKICNKKDNDEGG